VVAIGSSTGGPPVLQAILSALPRDYAAPVLIVQHMAAGFVGGLVDWLRHSAGLAVDIASHGEPLCPGRAYLAPDGCHMGVEPGGRIGLSRSEPEHRLRPAVSFLFRTVAQVYGARAIGVLLTGMGRDGAPELKLLRDTGGVTIAQDAASSVVHGMPGEAIRLGGAMYALPPVRIAAALRSLVRP
jgi:two-component system chemotaxis response regulator CheB